MPRYRASSGAAYRSGAGRRYQPGAPPPATAYLLGQLANIPALSLSTRKLGPGAGPCLRVRRSSDGAEQDFGYAANDILDTQAVLGFCGAGDGFVSRWHDNADPARFAAQTDPNQQPRIVAAGALQTLGGQPALSWPSSRSARMDYALSGMLDQFMGFAAIDNQVGTNQYGSRLLSYTADGDSDDYSTPNSIDALDIRLGRTLSTYVANAGNYNPSVAMPAGPQLVSASIDGAQGFVRIYHGSQSTVATSGDFGPSGTLVIGNNFGGERFIGLIGDLIVQTAVAPADLGLIEAAAASFYGIA